MHTKAFGYYPAAPAAKGARLNCRLRDAGRGATLEDVARAGLAASNAYLSQATAPPGCGYRPGRLRTAARA